MLSIIVAHDQQRLIGINNQMPWQMPADLRYFRQQTLGKTVVMGRKTFDSIGKALPERTNIILTHQPEQAFPVKTIHALADLQHLAKTPEEEVMIIGGATVYAATLALVNRLYITEIHHTFPISATDNAAYFPLITPEHWQETARRDFPADDKNPYPYSFTQLNRRA